MISSYQFQLDSLPILHLKLWYKAILSKTSNLVGTPLYMDRATIIGERLTYARCFVEISSNKPLSKSVIIQLNDEQEIQLDVEVEWVPSYVSQLCLFWTR